MPATSGIANFSATAITSISDLPTELVLLIFDDLTPHELSLCTIVSRAWHGPAHRALWSKSVVKFKHLLALLAPVEVVLIEGKDHESLGSITSEAINREARERFLRHARLVKTIQWPVEIVPHTVLLLQQMFPHQTLFPTLSRLRIQLQGSYPCRSTVLSSFELIRGSPVVAIQAQWFSRPILAWDTGETKKSYAAAFKLFWTTVATLCPSVQEILTYNMYLPPVEPTLFPHLLHLNHETSVNEISIAEVNSLSAYPSLRRAQVRGSSRLPSTPLAPAPTSVSLRRLDIHSRRMFEMLDLLSTPLLTTLSVIVEEVTNADLSKLSIATPLLQHLNIISAKPLRYSHVRAISSFENLRSLVLHSPNAFTFSDNDLDLLAKGLGRLESLGFIAPHKTVPDADPMCEHQFTLSHLVRLARHCASLSTLEVALCATRTPTPHHIPLVLPKLKHLSIYALCVEEEITERIGEVLSDTCPTVDVLEVRTIVCRSEVDDRGERIKARVLQSFNTRHEARGRGRWAVLD